MQKVFFAGLGIWLVYGNTIYSLYSIQIIMSKESPHKTLVDVALEAMSYCNSLNVPLKNI